MGTRIEPHHPVVFCLGDETGVIWFSTTLAQMLGTTPHHFRNTLSDTREKLALQQASERMLRKERELLREEVRSRRQAEEAATQAIRDRSNFFAKMVGVAVPSLGTFVCVLLDLYSLPEVLSAVWATVTRDPHPNACHPCPHSDPKE